MALTLHEKYWHQDPWRVLVISILNSHAQRQSTEATLQVLFAVWPTAYHMSKADKRVVGITIQSLGFSEKRTEHLMDLANAWTILSLVGTQFERLDPRQFQGCGEYAYEAWRMFVLKERTFIPKNRVLYQRMQELLTCRINVF